MQTTAPRKTIDLAPYTAGAFVDLGAFLAANPPGPWQVVDARGAVKMQLDTEQEAQETAAAWNAETDPAQRVDDGAYPFAARHE